MPNIGDYYGQGARVASSGPGLIASAIVANGYLGMQWPTADRVFYGATVRLITGSDATWIFLFDSTVLPAPGAIVDDAVTTYVYDVPVVGTPPLAVNLPAPPAGMYFAHGIVVVGSTSAFPTLTFADADMSVAIYYGRVT